MDIQRVIVSPVRGRQHPRVIIHHDGEVADESRVEDGVQLVAIGGAALRLPAEPGAFSG
jgi:hypothetical protein